MGSIFHSVDSGVANTLWRSVWGTAKNNVWAGGDQGTLIRWNGLNWTTVFTNPNRPINTIYGSGPNDIWAVGGNFATGTSTTLRWNGAQWSDIQTGVSTPLWNVWTAGKEHGAWLVGYDVILHCL